MLISAEFDELGLSYLFKLIVLWLFCWNWRIGFELFIEMDCALEFDLSVEIEELGLS